MFNLRQHLAFGIRQLVKHPGYSLTAILVLGIGIGATATIFSFFHAVLLRPLPYPNAERVVAVGSINSGAGQRKAGMAAPADFVDWKRESQSFDGLTAITGGALVVKFGDRSETLPGAVVSEDFFATFGIAPRLGRAFDRNDFVAETSTPPIILSHDLWQSRFNGDPAILGKMLELRGGTGTVIGVMPPEFKYPHWAGVWTPLANNNGQLGLRGNRYFEVIGRLAPGRSRLDAENEMKGIAARLAEQHPRENRGWSVQLVALREWINGDDRLPLTVLMAAVGFVLLIACANVAALSIARSNTRRREIAVRIALGVTRGKLVGQLLVESLLLAAVGGLLGLALANAGIPGLMLMLPEDDARRLAGQVRLDYAVFGFTALMTMLTGLFFGIAPARQVFAANPIVDLREGARGSEGGRHGRVRRTLVVAEIAFAITLLVGAGLLIRSFVGLLNDSPGYDPGRTMLVNLSAPLPFDATVEQKATFYRQALERVARVEGVRSVALTNGSQFGFLNFPVNRPDRPFPQGDVNTRYSSVSPNFFRTLGVPLTAGREFAETDTDRTPLVFIVNRTLARTYFSGEEPVGKRFVINYLNRRLTGEIVGVVGDIRQDAPGRETQPEVYASFAQIPWFSHYLVVRTTADQPLAAAAGINDSLRALDPGRDAQKPILLSEQISAGVAQPRLYAALLAVFAGIALLLASVGIYGVMAFTVAQRTREIGVRVALGARASDVVRLVLNQSLTLILSGIGIGLIASLILSRTLKTLLFGVSTNDPLTFIGVALLLAIVALLACWLPARRAAMTDPLTALRHE